MASVMELLWRSCSSWQAFLCATILQGCCCCPPWQLFFEEATAMLTLRHVASRMLMQC